MKKFVSLVSSIYMWDNKKKRYNIEAQWSIERPKRATRRYLIAIKLFIRTPLRVLLKCQEGSKPDSARLRIIEHINRIPVLPAHVYWISSLCLFVIARVPMKTHKKLENRKRARPLVQDGKNLISAPCYRAIIHINHRVRDIHHRVIRCSPD